MWGVVQALTAVFVLIAVCALAAVNHHGDDW